VVLEGSQKRSELAAEAVVESGWEAEAAAAALGWAEAAGLGWAEPEGLG